MSSPAWSRRAVALWAALVCSAVVQAADIIVSERDGKFVRVEGRSTFPPPARHDSLVVLDASQSPAVIKGILGGLEHRVHR